MRTCGGGDAGRDARGTRRLLRRLPARRPHLADLRRVEEAALRLRHRRDEVARAARLEHVASDLLPLLQHTRWRPIRPSLPRISTRGFGARVDASTAGLISVHFSREEDWACSIFTCGYTSPKSCDFRPWVGDGAKSPI